MNRKTIAIVCLIFVIVLFSALQGQILLGIIMALLTPIIIGLLQFEEKISQVIDKYLENHGIMDKNSDTLSLEHSDLKNKKVMNWKTIAIVCLVYAIVIYFALQGQNEKTLQNLQKAVELGFNDLEWVKTDSSLESIREEGAYLEIVRQMEKKQ